MTPSELAEEIEKIMEEHRKIRDDLNIIYARLYKLARFLREKQ